MRSGIGICRADGRYGLLGTGLTSAKGIRGRSGKTLQGEVMFCQPPSAITDLHKRPARSVTSFSGSALLASILGDYHLETIPSISNDALHG
jgi:hypothetical protein